MKTTACPVLLSLCMISETPTASAEDFSTRVVDGLGRPVADAVVEVEWWEKQADGKIREVSLLKMKTDANGMVKGQFDRNSLPQTGHTDVQLSKEGYRSYSPSGFDPEYVLKRVFHAADFERALTLADEPREQALRELQAGEFEDFDLMRKLFDHEDRFRPALRHLVEDTKVAPEASCIWPALAILKTCAGLPSTLLNPSEQIGTMPGRTGSFPQCWSRRPTRNGPFSSDVAWANMMIPGSYRARS